MNYDFSNLTTKQEELLTFQGWCARDSQRSRPHSSTARKLIARGLLLAHMNFSGVTEYYVPLDVHRAWCKRCAEADELATPPQAINEGF